MPKCKIFIETYGCTANQSDSEIMKGILSKDFVIIDSVENSDLNIINTCIVKTPTENRMKFRIRELSNLGKPLIVAGCMSDTEREVIEGLNPSASMIGSNSVENIGFVVKKALQGEKVSFLEYGKKSKLELPKIRKNNVIDIVQVSTGCLGNCSFCQTKFARGTLKSYSPKLIVKSIEDGLKSGCKEFWFTSQDMGCYGLDIGINLPELLEMVAGIDGKFLIRVGMMNPTHVKNFLDELVEAYRSEKIFKFLHMPLQSGSDRILEMMKRGYDVKDFKNIVSKFKEEFPELVFSTDMIVGFPTETGKDFEKSMEIIKEVKPDNVNVSAFGKRPETEAYGMKQVDTGTIKERTREMSRLVRQISNEQNTKWKNWEGEIIIDDVVDGRTVGRNQSYKQIFIDGQLGEFKIGRIYS
jgi:threonylcarbamoyladenosine tRNA methylthiotransferase CDKAL1